MKLTGLICDNLTKKNGQKYLIEKKKWIVNLIDNSIYSNCFLFSPS